MSSFIEPLLQIKVKGPIPPLKLKSIAPLFRPQVVFITIVESMGHGVAFEQEFTEGPLFSVNVHEPAELKVAVTTLAVPSAFSLTPVNVSGLINGADMDKGPPPISTSPVKSKVPVTGGFVKVTVRFDVK